MMQRDIRDTALFKEAEALYTVFRQPGTGRLGNAAEIHASPDGRRAVFTGTLHDKLEGTGGTRVCCIDLASGDLRVLTFGPGADRLPKYSPDGSCVAFLSDRHRAGDFQLYLASSDAGAVRPAARVRGWVEYLQWSPDGRRILLGVAGHGADVAGGQGAVTSKKAAECVPSWMPTVEDAEEDFRWRRAWVYDLASDRAYQVSSDDTNVWEAAWCGNSRLAAIISPGPSEGLWYTARLHTLDVETGVSLEIHTPRAQIGVVSGSSCGKHVAFVEGICSDRWVVAGDLYVIDLQSREARVIDTRGVDITCIEWRSDGRLLVAGHRGFETATGSVTIASETFTETWSSREITTGGFYVSVSGLGKDGGCVLIGESSLRAPEIAVIENGTYRTVKSFDFGYGEHAKAIDAIECVAWSAPDGLQIQGWLLRPKTRPPFPTIVWLHGGPVAQWRPWWLGRGGVPILMLIKHGYAVFLPNPRGSSGRGQDFVRPVLGDIGGADTYDCLSGIDHLIRTKVADPRRLGVTGGSYGGYLSSWLITQDTRFAAAVPVSPMTNLVTEYLVSNIPHFVDLFVADHYRNPAGKYFQRSPIMHADKVRTPTLNICGALDRCTPPGEAIQFHNALRAHGIESVLVTYPEEGHMVRKFPAAIDYTARLVGWFLEHMPPS